MLFDLLIGQINAGLWHASLHQIQHRRRVLLELRELQIDCHLGLRSCDLVRRLGGVARGKLAYVPVGRRSTHPRQVIQLVVDDIRTLLLGTDNLVEAQITRTQGSGDSGDFPRSC